MISRNYIFSVVFLAAVFFAGIECDVDVNAIANQITPHLSKLNSTADEFKNLFKQKCSNNSGSDAAYDALVRGSGDLILCMNGLVNITEMQREIEVATPNGELDTVFNKYCGRRNTGIGCFETFTNLAEPCLEADEKVTKNTLVMIVKKIMEFVCFKEGDQIALFIAEKGPECFSSQQNALLGCMNSTFPGVLPTLSAAAASVTLNSPQLNLPPVTLPRFVIGAQQCAEFDNLKKCVVESLEKCEESTPANLAEAMFKFVRNQSNACPPE